MEACVVSKLEVKSLADCPSPFLAGNLGVRAIVLFRVLDWSHTVDHWSALEPGLLPGGTCLTRWVLLENTLRRAGVGVGIGGHLQRRESLACRACRRDRRNGSSRNSTWRLERERWARSILHMGSVQRQPRFGGRTSSVVHVDWNGCTKIWLDKCKRQCRILTGKL